MDKKICQEKVEIKDEPHYDHSVSKTNKEIPSTMILKSRQCSFVKSFSPSPQVIFLNQRQFWSHLVFSGESRGGHYLQDKKFEDHVISELVEGS